MATARRSLVDVIAPEDIKPTSEAADKLLQIPIEQIHVHPKNPRHDATADDELLASVQEAGILVPGMVARHPEGSDPNTGAPRYMLVDGHCRLDAALRAGLSIYPAILRRDLRTEADQVKAMIITGRRRRDLTAIEEAEGYQLLLDLKVKVADIARDMGVSATLVRDRVKLLKLAPKVREQAHDGQITIEDALAIAALPDAEQAKVARSAGTSNFKYDLENAKRRAKAAAELKQKVDGLTAAGIPQRKMPANTGTYQLNDADHGMTRLWGTFSHDKDDHTGCLAFIVVGGSIEYVCTNIAAHDEQLSEQQRLQREEREREEAEQAARAEAESIAQRLRCDALMEAIKPGVKLDPISAGIIRALLPTLLEDLSGNGRARGFFEVLDLPSEDRWDDYGRYRWKDADHAAWDRMLTRIQKASHAELLRILCATLLADIERAYLGMTWTNGYARAPMIYDAIAAYYNVLDQTDWNPTDVDAEFRTIAQNAGEPEGEAAS